MGRINRIPGFIMSMVNFTRGELSPMMKYRKDLEAYYTGVATLSRFMPRAKSGLVRGPGCQVLDILPPSDRAPAVRMFSLGSTGMSHDISKVGSEDTITIYHEDYDELTGLPAPAIYDTEFRIHDIPRDDEMDILLSFTEFGTADDIVAYWVNTPDGNPAFYQRIWNYESGFTFPAIDFDDTRDVRVAQVENSVYIIAKTQIYRLFWDKNKTVPTWNSGEAYAERAVVKRTIGLESYYFECTEGNTAQDPATASGMDYWRIVYAPFLSWEVVSPRVGYELLKGIGTDDDEYRWASNTDWASNKEYCKGDVVEIVTGGVRTVYECIRNHTTGDVTGKTPIEDAWAANWEALTDLSAVDIESETLTDEDGIYKRSSYAFREETVPREMAVHHNRLIFAGSSIRPSTIHGSEVYHYMNFGAGINDDEPWIVTLSGDRVGRILWLEVTDQLYIGTSGGIFAVSSILTPTSFQLRKVTSHATSEIHAVSAAGSIIFFHKDRKTLREIQYADQAENYHALDLTIFSDHLFEEFSAVKMVVVNDPSIVIWILRSNGTLVSLSYENTVGMCAFTQHELHGFLYDIVAGRGGELYGVAILDNTSSDPDHRTDVRQIIRIGYKDISSNGHSIKDIYLDGLISFVNIDTTNEFSRKILNQAMLAWYLDNGISSISDMFGWINPIDAHDSDLVGNLDGCGLDHLDEVPSINLSGNSLSGEVPLNMTNTMSHAENASLNLSGNSGLIDWKIVKIPASWVNINLSNTGFSIGVVSLILDSILASVATDPREGTLDLTGLGRLSMDDALSKAVTLKAAGWTVNIDNAAGWDSEYVSFNGNGSESGEAPASITCLLRQSITLPSHNTLAKADHEFNGWSEGADQNPEFSAGDQYTKQTEGSKTLYATWLPSNKVEYHANQGSGGPVDDDTYNPGDTVTIKSETPSRVGFQFTKWNTAANGSGTNYNPGNTFIMPAYGVTLYAQWEVKYHTIKFWLNGANIGVSPASLSIAYGDTFVVPPVIGMHRQFATGEWQKGDRWDSRTEGNGVAYTPGQTVRVYSNLDLYVKWSKYNLGDLGPGGGTIAYDFGSFAPRPVTFTEVFNQTTSRSFRYLEVMNQDYQSPNTFSVALSSFNAGVDWNGVHWGHLMDAHLRWVLQSGHVPNRTQSKYWTGTYGSRGVLFWKYSIYNYRDVSDNWSSEKETSNPNELMGIRLGRAI